MGIPEDTGSAGTCEKTIEFQTPEALIAFIQKSHDEYLERKKGVEEDIKKASW